jgi:predicted ATP-dependent protease
VILPAENKMNVEEDLTKEQLDNLKVHYVKTIDEALRVSLPEVAQSAAAKILTPKPNEAALDYQPAIAVKVPEAAQDKVLTTRA